MPRATAGTGVFSRFSPPVEGESRAPPRLHRKSESVLKNLPTVPVLLRNRELFSTDQGIAFRRSGNSQPRTGKNCVKPLVHKCRTAILADAAASGWTTKSR